jgi:hypothetical protein
MLIHTVAALSGKKSGVVLWVPSSQSVDCLETFEGRAGIQFRTDGTMWRQCNTTQTEDLTQLGFDWESPQSGDRWIRADVVVGSTPSGDSTGVWLPLVGAGAADRDWVINHSTTPGITQTKFRVRIATDASGTVVIIDTGSGIDAVDFTLDTT